MPKWYKDMPAFENNKFRVLDDGNANATAKLCVPFADAFAMGYIQETWTDIFIDAVDEDHVFFAYSSGPAPLEMRKPNIKVPKEYYNIEFAWKAQWIPKVPKGYSVIYTQPFNNLDLPFMSLTGIVDSDKYYHELEANHAFYLKKGFSGIIPVGTPMLQIIPFKRDNWKANFFSYDEKSKLLAFFTKKYYWGGYKKLFWTKKHFN